MQSLQPATDFSAGSYLCAQELLDTVPLVMRIIRAHMRQHRSGLTVPQFRTLCFVDSSTGCTLSEVADFIGLSLPAMSRLVDGLAEKGLVKRRPCNDDRRLVRLSLTSSGQSAIRGARALAQEKLADVISQLRPTEQNSLVGAMRMVREIFTVEPAPDPNNEESGVIVASAGKSQRS
jgi:DNA-binding MarR family transcriptional regulator